MQVLFIFHATIPASFHAIARNFLCFARYSSGRRQFSNAPTSCNSYPSRRSVLVQLSCLALHSFNVDLIVFLVTAYEFDEKCSCFVHHRNNKAIVIALDVENDPIVAYKACIAILRLDLCRGFPVCFGGFGVPSLQRLFGLRMLFPERSQC